MKTTDSEFTKKTLVLEEAQAKYLNSVAPGYRQKWIRWSGGQVQALQMGTGPRVLLIHGGLGEAFQYGTIISHLSKHYNVLAVDRPGHGLSDPMNYDGENLLNHSESFLNDIYKSEGFTKVIILASSMGGLWALNYALKYPERVGQIILLGSPAGVTKNIPAMLRYGTLPVLRKLVHAMMRKPTTESVRSFWKQMLVSRPEKLGQDFIEASVASQARNAPSWFTLIDAAMNVTGLRKQLIILDRLKQLSVPVTCLWGDKDVWAGPEIGVNINAITPHFKTVIIKNAGHAPWFDDLEGVLKEIDRALLQH